MKTRTVNGAKLTEKQFKWLSKKSKGKKFTSKEASKLLTKALSTPKMGAVIRDKMYRKPSIPAMGKKDKDFSKPGRSIGSDINDFFSGKQSFKKEGFTPEQTEMAKKQANKGLPTGAVRWGKGTYRMPGSDVSIPIMGPIGAVAGGYAGKKLGSWVGSAGKLIGKNHEKYGRQAGEYIFGTLGAGLGATLTPI